MRSCSRRVRPQTSATSAGMSPRIDDAGVHGVLEVVRAVRDPVGPADDLALDGAGRRPGPGVVADPVEGLGAQIERRQDDVRAPRAVVVALGDERVERILAGVTARPVAAVVPERDGVGQGHVDPGSRGRSRWRPGRPRGHGSAGSAGGRSGRPRPGSCRPAGGTRSSARSGRGPARSRCARSSGSSARHGVRRRRARVAPGRSVSRSRSSRSSPIHPRTGPDRGRDLLVRADESRPTVCRPSSSAQACARGARSAPGQPPEIPSSAPTSSRSRAGRVGEPAVRQRHLGPRCTLSAPRAAELGLGIAHVRIELIEKSIKLGERGDHGQRGCEDHHPPGSP